MNIEVKTVNTVTLTLDELEARAILVDPSTFQDQLRTAPPPPINFYDLPQDWRDAIIGLKRKALAESNPEPSDHERLEELEHEAGMYADNDPDDEGDESEDDDKLPF